MIGEGYTLYNMLQIYENLFENIRLYEKIDRDVCLTEIFKRCGDLPCIDFNPDIYKSYVEQFFAKNYDVFRNLYDSLHYEYEPLENLNRTDETQRVVENTAENTDTNNTNQENTISAMDSTSYQPDRKNELSSNTNSKSTNKGKDTYISKSHGTIGVITNQDMIEKQRRVVRYDFYADVAALYEKDLCVSLY